MYFKRIYTSVVTTKRTSSNKNQLLSDESAIFFWNDVYTPMSKSNFWVDFSLLTWPFYTCAEKFGSRKITSVCSLLVFAKLLMNHG